MSEAERKTENTKNENKMCVSQVIDGLDDLAKRLENVKEILSKENVYALSAAKKVLNKLQNLSITTWQSRMVNSDGEPIQGTEEAHAAIYFTDELPLDELRKIYGNHTIVCDPRVIHTTPGKAFNLLQHLGLSIQQISIEKEEKDAT